MLPRLKLFGGLILLLLILAAAYVVAVSLVNFGGKEESILKINGREIKIEIVDNPLAQVRGLGDRDSIDDDEGMLFVFPRPAIQRFWMKGMKFPIDIIWIRDSEIIGFEENVQPQPGARDENLKIYSSPERIDKVLEMKAGSIQRFGISLGNKVEF
jgi:uncharacterized membrane protein (UPF0127 family)